MGPFGDVTSVVRNGGAVTMILLMMLMWDTVSLDHTLLWLSQSLTQMKSTSRKDTGEHLSSLYV